MAKWISPIFSDARNKLGDAVVFSNWKGRSYFRSYVIPANPRTNPQKANRAVQALLVKRWQEIIDTQDKKAAWNAVALKDQISGYNLFVKEGRRSKISCPATATLSGSPATASITVTYTLGVPAAVAKIYMYDGSTWKDVTPSEGLSSEPDSTITVTVSAAGTYYFFIADSRVLVPGDTPPKDYQAITKWQPDYSTGTAEEAKCVVS